MINTHNTYPIAYPDRWVISYQRHESDTPLTGATTGEPQAITQTATQSAEQAQPTIRHPLQAEIDRVQQVLDALAACPPRGWMGRLLWRGLHRSYHDRLRKTTAAWVATLAKSKGTILEAKYDFEPEMVLIAAGEFMMGSDSRKDQHARHVERPQHKLHLPDYYLAKTPVTNAQYAAFVRATQRTPPSHWQEDRPPKAKENHPVVRVSWYDAIAYCKWLSGLTGQAYRLPTEAEWEKAARGDKASMYPWGDRWDASRCNTKESETEDTTPVGAYPQGASPYGLLDMAGNVWEWTSSLYRDYPYRKNDGREDPSSTKARVLRGGSWLNFYDSARAAYRRSYTPAYHSRIHGFRCCVSLGPPGDA
ncbi:MAG: formylglycine-generating enzyme family protein [Anaerolineae bacterium]|nr:formylglycine-generating enzyme family protein [Anaerolineae bacterium]